MPSPPDEWEDGFDEVHAEDREIQVFGVKSLASRTLFVFWPLFRPRVTDQPRTFLNHGNC
jgi:hypothetical protein